MNLEKNLKLTMLFEFYSKLLTEKQQNIFIMYYFDDISLGEIAVINNISRQAVRDSLIKAESSLRNFEEKLGMVSKYEQTKKILNSNDIHEEIKMKILQVWEGK